MLSCVLVYVLVCIYVWQGNNNPSNPLAASDSRQQTSLLQPGLVGCATVREQREQQQHKRWRTVVLSVGGVSACQHKRREGEGTKGVRGGWLGTVVVRV